MISSMQQALLDRAAPSLPGQQPVMANPSDYMQQMLAQQNQTPNQPAPVDKAQQAAEGLRKLQELAAKSKEANAKVAPPKPEAPPVDTSSLGALLSSLFARGKYAVYGAPEEKK